MAKIPDVDIDLIGKGENTKIEYQYRDQDNYKKGGTAILRGRLTPENVLKIVGALDEGQFFIPGQVGLQDLQSQFLHGAGWDEQSDHPWHELQAISYTDDPAGITPAVDLARDWPTDKSGWDAAEATARLQTTLPAVTRP